MAIIQDIKNKAGNFLINKKLKVKRKRVEFHNFESAKRIHLFFDATEPEDYNEAKTFLSDLKEKGIKVKAVGMTKDDEQKANYLYHKEVTFISPKDTNWFGKPKVAIIDEMNADTANMFINLAFEECFAGRYISAFSTAEFKVSGITDDKIADLVIDVADKKNIFNLINQTKHFLNTIKKA